MAAERTKVTVGVCGGIAAYKSVELVRLLQDAGYDPHVVMTKAAEEFVRPLTFAAISGHKAITSLWGEEAERSSGDEAEEDSGEAGEGAGGGITRPTDATSSTRLGEAAETGSVEHIHEAQTTHLLIVAPATADILAKFAHGL